MVIINTVAIIALVVILVFAFVGYKRGLIMSIYHLASFIIVLLLTMILGRFVVNYAVNNKEIYDAVYQKVVDNVDLPTAREILSAGEVVTDIIDGMRSSLYDKMTVTVIMSLAYVVTWIVVAIAVRILFSLLDLISRLPILNVANHLGGLALGVVEAVIIIWLVCGLKPVFTSFETTKTVATQIEENKFLDYMSEHNLVNTVISRDLKNVLIEFDIDEA